MTILDHKIDFAVVLSVTHANPNGDPLNGNRPRQNYDGRGEISDVCLKRKIRNRLQDMGAAILVQSDDRRNDAYQSIKDRVDGNADVKEFASGKKANSDLFAGAACETWLDVRSFGQVFAFSSKDKEEKGKGVSVGVRGPVSLHTAFSVDPIDIVSTQITKSVNTETSNKKGSDTMGMKHRVDFGVYTFFGSINTQLAEKTGFTNEDAEKIKQALITLFENDVSSARPDGTMEIIKVVWWEHNSKLGQYSSAKVHRALKVEKREDVTEPKAADHYVVSVDMLDGLSCHEYAGL
ncbi:MAG: CRISPR-associated protein [Paenibacillaceae bacterium]|jgi:CRISPR-associated protein Csd2|nr:CRISPR-associated protein [Paenibacillaceae bacterium]